MWSSKDEQRLIGTYQSPTLPDVTDRPLGVSLPTHIICYLAQMREAVKQVFVGKILDRMS